MGKSNTELIKIALGHLGEGGAKFRRFAGLPSGAAWCNAFVDYIANEAGDARLYFNGKKETYCPSSIKWCQKNLAELPPYLALPADIIYFDWELNGRPNHIGLVRARKSTSSVYTVEGNTSGGKVAKKTRATKYVQGIYRPLFVPAKVGKAKLKIDGLIGYTSIYNLQRALGMKPTGTFTKETVKILQKKAGATQDGVWGPGTSRKVQKMIGAAQDGDFGPASAKKLQQWVNRINYPPTTKKPAAKPAPAPAKPATPSPAKPTTTGKAYAGSFPTLNTNAKIVNGLAFRYCWPYGTPEKKYKYSTGKPTAAYKKGIDEAYPKHKSWPNKKQRVGACCDVFVGAVLGHVGVKVSKDLKNQLIEMPKMTSKLKSNGHHTKKQFKAGDVVQRGRKDKSGHTWVVCELVNGKKYVANAHYKKLKGTYAVMDATPKDVVPSKWKYYKCYTVQGAVRTYYKRGDYGHDVKYAQLFLKWYGIPCTADGDYGEKTEAAVKKFQTKVGIPATGRVDAKTISKMKAARK